MVYLCFKREAMRKNIRIVCQKKNKALGVLVRYTEDKSTDISVDLYKSLECRVQFWVPH